MARKVRLSQGRRGLALPTGLVLTDARDVVISDRDFADLAQFVQSGGVLDLGETDEPLTPTPGRTSGGGADQAALEDLEGRISLRLEELEAMGGSGAFRGEYQGAVRFFGEDFGAGSLPEGWTVMADGGSVGPISMSSALGLEKPEAYTSALSIYRNSRRGVGQPAASATLDLSAIPALAGRTLTEIRFWGNLYRAAPGGATIEMFVDGTPVLPLTTPLEDAPQPWQHHVIPLGSSLTSESVLTWSVTPTSASFATQTTFTIAGLEIYGPSEPYMFDHYVIHNAQMWKSTIDNNPNEPGGPGWVQVALADLQDVDSRLESLEQRAETLEQRVTALESTDPVE